MDLLLDISLAIGSAVVAIFGTAYDPAAGRFTTSLETVYRICNLKHWQADVIGRRVLIALAVVICGFAIGKSVGDDHDKKFMKAALVATLSPKPDVIREVAAKMQGVAQDAGYSGLDYNNVSNGMVFFLARTRATDGKKPIPDDSENDIVILNDSQLAELYSLVILKEDPTSKLREYFKQNLDLEKFSDDVYDRLCALFSSSVRRVLYKQPVNCDYDDTRGITLTFNVNNIEQQAIFSPAEIGDIAKNNTNAARTALGLMDRAFRQKVPRPNPDKMPQAPGAPATP